MKVEDFEKLVDYVADLRSKFQHAKARREVMIESMQLLAVCGADMVELCAWRDTMEDHERFIDNLKVQLGEYEHMLGWPLTTEAA